MPIVFALLFSLATLTSALHGQAPATACSDSLGKTMAFLEGTWKGRSYSIAGRDTVLDAVMKVRSQPLYGRCALEEQWEARKDQQVLFVAKVLRAYDASTQRWMVHYVDDALNSQVYEGRMNAGEWRFFRSRMDRGVPIHVRLTWRPSRDGYEQLIERSRDGGSTWTLGGYVSFLRD